MQRAAAAPSADYGSAALYSRCRGTTTRRSGPLETANLQTFSPYRRSGRWGLSMAQRWKSPPTQLPRWTPAVTARQRAAALPRCSRNAPPTLLIAPAPRPFPAPGSCGQGPKRPPRPASGLPAGCLPPQRGRLGCWSSVSLPAAGHVCSRAVAATRAATSLQCLCDVRGCSGVLGRLCVLLGGCRNVAGDQI
jgi:hypothetical protein